MRTPGLLMLLVSWLVATTPGSKERTFRGRIVDSETGSPLHATVSAATNNGVELKPDGASAHVFYLGKKRWYVEGDFSLTTTEDSLELEIRRGLETVPIKETVHLTDSSKAIREFKLRRWVDMAEKGYYSGDTHVHFLDTKSAYLQMQAEDLHVVNLLTSDFTHDSQKFTGTLDKVSTQHHFVYVGQELRDWQMGHVSLLRLRQLIQPLEPYGGKFVTGTHPNFLLSPRLEEAKKQEAAAVWAHFSNLPGLESAIAIPLGLIDAVELITYDDPTQLPTHWAPWEYSDMSQSEFTVMRGVDLYYQYLNAGFKLPITAGTDKMSDNIPVGSNRHYVRVSGEATYDNWIEGLKRGTGFVTNGPILTFTVNGHLSGESISFAGEKAVSVFARAESLLPYGRLEVLVNGRIVASKELPRFIGEQELYVTELTVNVRLSESAWIAARVTSRKKKKIMPRNLTVFAHSNPIYFLRNDKLVHVEAAVTYLVTYLKAVGNWIEKYSEFRTIAEKEAAKQYLEMARNAILTR